MDKQSQWRRSSYCSPSNCVEVVTTLDAVRDSKQVDGPVLRVDVGALLDAVKADQFQA
jgi:hypothetical protein